VPDSLFQLDTQEKIGGQQGNMKTLDEAMGCIIRESDTPVITSQDHFSGENLASLGRDIGTNEKCLAYIYGVMAGLFGEAIAEDAVVADHVENFGVAMFTAGVRVGIEMEKP
jgi:hypothetical protein